MTIQHDPFGYKDKEEVTVELVNISLTRKLKVGILISKYYALAVIHRLKVNYSKYEKIMQGLKLGGKGPTICIYTICLTHCHYCLPEIMVLSDIPLHQMFNGTFTHFPCFHQPFSLNPWSTHLKKPLNNSFFSLLD